MMPLLLEFSPHGLTTNGGSKEPWVTSWREAFTSFPFGHTAR